MVTHRLREGEDLATILIAGGNAPAVAGDDVYRKMNDGSYRIEVVDATGALVPIFSLTKQALDLMPRLSEVDGVLALDGQKLAGLTPEQQATISAMIEAVSDLTSTTSIVDTRLTTLEQTIAGTPPPPVYAHTITPGDLPDVSAITSVVAGTTFAEILALVPDAGSATVTGGEQVRIFLSVISDTGSDPVQADDRIMGVQQTFAYPGAETIVREEIAQLNIAVEAEAIKVVREPSTSGLSGLTTAMTPQEAEVLWTGAPIGMSNNGAEVLYDHAFIFDGAPVASDSLFAEGEYVIETTMTAAKRIVAEDGRETVTNVVTTPPFLVMASDGQATITGDGPELLATVLAGTPVGYQVRELTRTGYTSSNGSPVTVTASRLRIDGDLVSYEDRYNRLIEVGDVVIPQDSVSAEGARSTTISGTARTAVISTISVTEGKEASVGEVVSGLTEAEVVALVDPGASTSNNGRTVMISISAERNGAAFNGARTAVGDEITFAIERTATGAAPLPSTLTTTVVAAQDTGPAIPDTGPYTLAQVEALRTDGTTRGVPAAAIPVLKKPGTANPLPTGMTRSGTRITIATGADIPVLEGWDFSGYDWVVKGRMRGLINTAFGYPTDLGLALFDLYPSSHIDKFQWSSFLGAGYYGSLTTKTCLLARVSGTDGPQVDLIERCDFFGWGSDTIKSSWDGVIRLCYFDTPINLPKGTAVWNPDTNYAVGATVVSVERDGKYGYKSLTGGRNKTLPSRLASNTDWQNIDPHSDTINPFLQLGPGKLLIEAPYINRNEALRAVDPGQRRFIGATNAVRMIRNTGDLRPINEIEVVNLVSTKAGMFDPNSPRNDSYPIQFEHLSEEGAAVSTVRDSWIGHNVSGVLAHPSSVDGHIVSNVVDYPTPTNALPSASYGQAGTPANTGGTDTGGDTGGDTPAPVIDITVPLLLLSVAQSEPVYCTIEGSHYNSRTYPTPRASNWTSYHQKGAENLVQGLEKFALTKGVTPNYNNINHCEVALANFMDFAVPGKKVVFASSHEEGTSRRMLMNDGPRDANGVVLKGDRDFKWLRELVARVEADFPGAPWARYTTFWYAADGSRQSEWLEWFAPFYFGQNADGTRFELGTYHPKAGCVVNHCIFDYEEPDPTKKGRGLLPRTAALDYVRRGNWGQADDETARRAGIEKFTTDPRFVALGGEHGPNGSQWVNNGGGHPNLLFHEGQREAAYDFWVPSLLRGAGIPCHEPFFRDGVFSADGKTCIVEFVPRNGGVLSTKAAVHGKTYTKGDLSNDIYGFELVPADGSWMHPFARLGAPNVPARYRAEVKKLDDTHAIITPEIPFVNEDRVQFYNGIGRRSGYSGVNYSENNTSQMLKMLLPIEHVAAYTDRSQEWPFAGFGARNYGAQWTCKRGSKVIGVIPEGGTPNTVGTVTTTPTEPTEPTPSTEAFTFGSAGPVLQDPSNVPENTTEMMHRFKIRVPATVAENSASRHIVAQENAGFDIALLVNAGAISIVVRSVKDQSGVEALGYTPIVTGMERDTWYEIEVRANMAAKTLTHRTNGGTVQSVAMTGPATASTFQITRANVYFKNPASSSGYVHQGVQMEYVETYLKTNGTEAQRKRATGPADTINADPWKVAGTSNAT